MTIPRWYFHFLKRQLCRGRGGAAGARRRPPRPHPHPLICPSEWNRAACAPQTSNSRSEAHLVGRPPPAPRADRRSPAGGPPAEAALMERGGRSAGAEVGAGAEGLCRRRAAESGFGRRSAGREGSSSARLLLLSQDVRAQKFDEPRRNEEGGEGGSSCSSALPQGTARSKANLHLLRLNDCTHVTPFNKPTAENTCADFLAERTASRVWVWLGTRSDVWSGVLRTLFPGPLRSRWVGGGSRGKALIPGGAAGGVRGGGGGGGGGGGRRR
ncbi:unnamed protein product [Gadus morhua 'NCC']